MRIRSIATRATLVEESRKQPKHNLDHVDLPGPVIHDAPERWAHSGAEIDSTPWQHPGTSSVRIRTVITIVIVIEEPREEP